MTVVIHRSVFHIFKIDIFNQTTWRPCYASDWYIR